MNKTKITEKFKSYTGSCAWGRPRTCTRSCRSPPACPRRGTRSSRTSCRPLADARTACSWWWSPWTPRSLSAPCWSFRRRTARPRRCSTSLSASGVGEQCVICLVFFYIYEKYFFVAKILDQNKSLRPPITYSFSIIYLNDVNILKKLIIVLLIQK